MQLPSKITGFRSRVINDLIDFVASLQPLRSSSVKHSWTSKGIAYDVVPANDFLDEFDYTRFRLDFKNSTTVTVLAGNLTQFGESSIHTKNNTDITGIGDDIGGYAATFAASDTFYVWLFIDAGVLKIKCGTALPTLPSVYWALGEFQTDGSGKVASSTVVRYYIGDIEVPSFSADYVRQVYQRLPDVGGNQVYGFDYVRLL